MGVAFTSPSVAPIRAAAASTNWDGDTSCLRRAATVWFGFGLVGWLVGGLVCGLWWEHAWAASWWVLGQTDKTHQHQTPTSPHNQPNQSRTRPTSTAVRAHQGRLSAPLPPLAI